MESLYTIKIGTDHGVGVFTDGENYGILWNSEDDCVLTRSADDIIRWAVYVTSQSGWLKDLSDFILGYFPEEEVAMVVLECM